MSDRNVFQLQTLDLIIGSKVKLYAPETILVLGAASGNGFGNFSCAKEVFAVDINSEFLDLCSRRYKDSLSKLVLLNCDINTQSLPVLDACIDVIICHLFLEYADTAKTFSEMKRVLKQSGICNIVIQMNNNNPFVSDTGITSLNILEEIAKDVSAEDVEKLTGEHAFKIIKNEEFPLPNGKSFISYDIGN